jgi:hypothetical protein
MYVTTPLIIYVRGSDSCTSYLQDNFKLSSTYELPCKINNPCPEYQSHELLLFFLFNQYGLMLISIKFEVLRAVTMKITAF